MRISGLCFIFSRVVKQILFADVICLFSGGASEAIRIARIAGPGVLPDPYVAGP